MRRNPAAVGPFGVFRTFGVFGAALVVAASAVGVRAGPADAAAAPAAGGLSIALHAAPPADLNADRLADAGDLVAYTYTVRNTGPLPVDELAVIDPAAGPVTCPQPSLAAGAAEICTADAPYMISSSDDIAGVAIDTARAAGLLRGHPRRVVSAPSSVSTATTQPDGRLALVMSANPASVTDTGDTGDTVDIGDSVDTEFAITNDGNLAIAAITVAGGFARDGAIGPVNCPAGALDPGATVVCSASRRLSWADLDAGTMSGTAVAEGLNPVGNPVTSNPSTTAVVVTGRAGLATQIRTAPMTPDEFVAGQPATFTVVATNTGTVDIDQPRVVATDLGGASLTLDCPATAVLSPSASEVCTAAHRIAPADVDMGSVADVASVSGAGSAGGLVTSTAAVVSTPESPEPAVRLVMTAQPPAFTSAGQTITYSFGVSNAGNVSLSDVHLVDSEPGSTDPALAIRCPDAVVVPGAHLDCTQAYVVTPTDVDGGRIDRTATVGASDRDGDRVGFEVSSRVEFVGLSSVGLWQPPTDSFADTAGQPS